MTSIMPDDNHSNIRIKKLSPLLINQLAAGEVVTRPSAVVKELLENAIDAGATEIEIRITQGGMGMIEVVDNGVGIHPEDIIMAITRHATSKVADIANLHGISTLGFRGEALAATAAVSRLTLTSSHDDSGIGRQLQVAGVLADTPKLTPVVHNQGTTITVKDLYFNVPARRGNLKSIGTEFAHIETVVREVALARADITLSLYHDHKKRLTLSATSMNSAGSRADGSNENYLPITRLEQALGLKLADNALEVMVDLSSLLHQSSAASGYSNQPANISGWLWPVTGEQTNQVTSISLPKLLYVNGRLVKEPAVSNQLRQLASSAQLNGMGYALYFELPAQWINVNVHPTKQRIKISPLNNILAHLSHVVALKLKNINKNSHEAVPLKDTPFKNVPSSQQVRAPQSLYQHSDNQQLSKNLSSESSYLDISNTSSDQQVAAANAVSNFDASSFENSYLKTPVDTSFEATSFAKENSLSSTNDDLSYVVNGFSLPQCLDIINSISKDYEVASVDITASENQSLLPWLLFYCRGQCLLISEEQWRGIWHAGFGIKPESQILYEQQRLESEPNKKNNTPTSAMMINQQINSYAEKMPTQQLATFKTVIEQALSINAHSIITTEQLLKVMLLSASS